jgi:hypothetical protein
MKDKLLKEECVNVGTEVLSELANKSTIFWHKTPCSPVKANFSKEHIVSVFMVEQ